MRVAVLSPSVNRYRGTERAVAELVERLACTYHYEVHVYAHDVDDLTTSPYARGSATAQGRIVWHRIRRIRGPHLIQFLYWMVANRVLRIWDRYVGGLVFGLVISPGINALDADLILVHAVFHRLNELKASRQEAGLRSLHRSLYYWLVCFLESRVYRQKGVCLTAVSRHTADQLKRYFGRADVAVIPNGVDTAHFSPEQRAALRQPARQQFKFPAGDFVLLLVGNDLRNKGLPALLDAVGLCDDLPLRLCVLGGDAAYGAAEAAARGALRDRVEFFPETREILPFYAAADAYIAPSLEDSFNLPVLEAMACGLPVIASVQAGVSENIHDGETGYLLREPQNACELAGLVRKLFENASLRQRLGDAASRYVQRNCTWDQNAASTHGALLATLSDRESGIN